MTAPPEQMTIFLVINLVLITVSAAGGFFIVQSSRARAFITLIVWQFIFMIAAGTFIPGSPLPRHWMSSFQQLLVCGAVYFFLGFDRREIGLTLPRGRKAWSWAGILLLAATTLGGLAILLSPARWRIAPPIGAGTEYVELWHAFMPGITEELAYRGLFLALLQRDIEAKEQRKGLIMAGGITTVLFSALHFVPYDGADWILINVARVAYALVLGVVLLLVRVKTESLIAGMAVHNAGNIARDVVLLALL